MMKHDPAQAVSSGAALLFVGGSSGAVPASVAALESSSQPASPSLMATTLPAICRT